MPYLLATFTNPRAVSINEYVFAEKRMSALAENLGCMALDCDFPKPPASRVLPARHYLQMVRIYTPRHTTQMVDLQTFRNRALEMLVG